MSSQLRKLIVLSAMCLALLALAKTLKIEVFVFDPDEGNPYVYDISLTVTAYDSSNLEVASVGPLSPSGPNGHVRFDVPSNTDHLSIDVFDQSDNCHQVFNESLAGRPHVGGMGFYLNLSGC